MDEQVKWVKYRPNIHYEMVDSGHFNQSEKPEVFIAAINILIK